MALAQEAAERFHIAMPISNYWLGNQPAAR